MRYAIRKLMLCLILWSYVTVSRPSLITEIVNPFLEYKTKFLANL